MGGGQVWAPRDPASLADSALTHLGHVLALGEPAGHQNAGQEVGQSRLAVTQSQSHCLEVEGEACAVT